MQFIIGEGITDWMTWARYRGAIGLFFDTTKGGILAYAIFGAFCFFAVIGLLTTVKWILFGGKKKKKDTRPSSLERDVKKIDRSVEEIKRYIDQK